MSTSALTINGKQWKSILKTLAGLATYCNDIDIRDGIIRQQANGDSAIFEADLRPVVGNRSFAIANVKEKLKVLKPFTGRVMINLDEVKFDISDNFTSHSILHPDMRYLNNKFLSQSEFESIFRDVFREALLLIRNRAEKLIRKRIRKAISKHKAYFYKIVFFGSSAILRAQESEASNEPGKVTNNFIKDIPLFESTSGYTKLPLALFSSFDFEEDPVWEVYRKYERLFFRIRGRIGGINAAVYAPGELKSNPPGNQKQV